MAEAEATRRACEGAEADGGRRGGEGGAKIGAGARRELVEAEADAEAQGRTRAGAKPQMPSRSLPRNLARKDAEKALASRRLSTHAGAGPPTTWAPTPAARGLARGAIRTAASTAAGAPRGQIFPAPHASTRHFFHECPHVSAPPKRQTTRNFALPAGWWLHLTWSTTKAGWATTDAHPDPTARGAIVDRGG